MHSLLYIKYMIRVHNYFSVSEQYKRLKTCFWKACTYIHASIVYIYFDFHIRHGVFFFIKSHRPLCFFFLYMVSVPHPWLIKQSWCPLLPLPCSVYQPKSLCCLSLVFWFAAVAKENVGRLLHVQSWNSRKSFWIELILSLTREILPYKCRRFIHICA